MLKERRRRRKGNAETVRKEDEKRLGREKGES